MGKVGGRYWIDILMGLAFLVVFITGIMKFHFMMTLLGIEINYKAGSLLYTISRVHDYAGIAMGLFVFIHLALNRAWIIAQTKMLFSK